MCMGLISEVFSNMFALYQARRLQNLPTVPSSIQDELNCNPFMRVR